VCAIIEIIIKLYLYYYYTRLINYPLQDFLSRVLLFVRKSLKAPIVAIYDFLNENLDLKDNLISYAILR
jgi:hypothetical protein